MSKNIRKKYQRAPAKVSQRRGSDTPSSSSLHLSDEDGYSAVEDISDSDEDDEDHVEAAEEEHITEDAWKGAYNPSRPRDEAVYAGEEDAADDEEIQEENAYEDSGSAWEGIMSSSDGTVEPETAFIMHPGTHNVERRVRFIGVSDSDSDSTTSDRSDDVGDFFPDIFVEQSSLDPAFRREIENDDDSSGSGSFWDYNASHDPWADSDDDEAKANAALENDTPIITPVPREPLTMMPSPVMKEAQELDGYESDGDTTEEDTPEPSNRKKQICHASPQIERSSLSEAEYPVSGRRGQPRLGRYSLDDSEKKPIAVLNPLTRKMMIFTPQKRRQFDLAPESFDLDFMDHGIIQSSPILSNPASLMMSAMVSSNTFGDFMNSQPFGPAEAFFPFTSDPMGTFDSDGSDVDEGGDDEDEHSLQLEDFITFNQDSSEDDEEGDDVPKEDEDKAVEASEMTPRRPRAQSAVSAKSDAIDVHPLLSHFDNNSNAVGAFRRNQITQQLILSDKASSESLAFSGPYHYGTLRGIKNGSLETVTTPITPVRRQKRKSSFAATNDGPRQEGDTASFDTFSNLTGSPLFDVSPKRKASAAVDGHTHKRWKSNVSDMNVIQY